MTKPLNVLSDLYSRIASLDQAIAALAQGACVVGVEEVFVTTTLTIPAEAKAALVVLVGAGAGGTNAYASDSNYSGGGGGCGEKLLGLVVGLVGGETVVVTIGEAGAANTSGGATSFGAYLTAEGGVCTGTYVAGSNGDPVAGTNGHRLMSGDQKDATAGSLFSLGTNAIGGSGATLEQEGEGGKGTSSVPVAATGYGCGGAGGGIRDNGTKYSGGAGRPGRALVIWLG